MVIPEWPVFISCPMYFQFNYYTTGIDMDAQMTRWYRSMIIRPVWDKRARKPSRRLDDHWREKIRKSDNIVDHRVFKLVPTPKIAKKKKKRTNSKDERRRRSEEEIFFLSLWGHAKSLSIEKSLTFVQAGIRKDKKEERGRRRYEAGPNPTGCKLFDYMRRG